MTDINQEELAKCLNLLQSLFGEAKIIFEWLYFPHPNLGGKRPLDAIIEGNSSAVIKILNNMKKTTSSYN